MKKWLLAFALALLAIPASAQTSTAQLTSTTCPGSGCLIASVRGQGSIGIQVTGTFVGTLQFEQSIDNGTYVTLAVFPNASTTSVTSATATGYWTTAVAGASSVRVRFSAYTSGTAVVTTSSAQARIFTNPAFGTVTAGQISLTNGSVLKDTADGVMEVTNAAGSNFTRLMFGGTTSSFPSLKANGGFELAFRAADDSTDGNARAGDFFTNSGSIANGSGTGITVNTGGALRTSVYKVTVLSTNFTAAATTADVTLGTLPAKTTVQALIADQTVTFACASVCTTATLSITCGKTAGGNEYLLSWDADAATGQFGITQATIGAALKFATPPITLLGDIPSWSGTTAVQCRLTSGAGNLGTGAATNLSAGSVTFYLVTTRLP
jgi:hypothetical protein